MGCAEESSHENEVDVVEEYSRIFGGIYTGLGIPNGSMLMNAKLWGGNRQIDSLNFPSSDFQKTLSIP